MNLECSVLSKKVVYEEVIQIIRRLYDQSISVVVMNNLLGQAIQNLRCSLSQGDVPSMFWYATGMDPHLVYLDKRLEGIPITSIPIHGPVQEGDHHAVLQPLQQRF